MTTPHFPRKAAVRPSASLRSARPPDNWYPGETISLSGKTADAATSQAAELRVGAAPALVRLGAGASGAVRAAPGGDECVDDRRAQASSRSLKVGDRLRFLCGVVLVALRAGAFAMRSDLVDCRVSKRLWRGQRRRGDDRPQTVAAVYRAAGVGGNCGSHSPCARRAGAGCQNGMEAVALGNVRLSLRTTAYRVAASSVAGIPGGLWIGREGR